MPVILLYLLAGFIGGVIGGIMGWFAGEKYESAAPREACAEFELFASSATHGDYRKVGGGPTFTIRRDELATYLDLTASAPWPRRIKVCVTIDGGTTSHTVTLP